MYSLLEYYIENNALQNVYFRHTSTCRAVSPVGESKGELLIGEDSVFFVADEAITDANYTQVKIDW